jgi:hypothetical protein
MLKNKIAPGLELVKEIMGLFSIIWMGAQGGEGCIEIHGCVIAGSMLRQTW